MAKKKAVKKQPQAPKSLWQKLKEWCKNLVSKK